MQALGKVGKMYFRQNGGFYEHVKFEQTLSTKYPTKLQIIHTVCGVNYYSQLLSKDFCPYDSYCRRNDEDYKL